MTWHWSCFAQSISLTQRLVSKMAHCLPHRVGILGVGLLHSMSRPKSNNLESTQWHTNSEWNPSHLFQSRKRYPPRRHFVRHPNPTLIRERKRSSTQLSYIVFGTSWLRNSHFLTPTTGTTSTPSLYHARFWELTWELMESSLFSRVLVTRILPLGVAISTPPFLKWKSQIVRIV